MEAVVEIVLMPFCSDLKRRGALPAPFETNRRRSSSSRREVKRQGMKEGAGTAISNSDSSSSRKITWYSITDGS